MYLLFVDESGTHGGSHSFILGGIAIHEDDAARLQRDLDALVVRYLGRSPVNLEEYELHAGEMRNAKKPKLENAGPASIWANFPRQLRLSLLDAAYVVIGNFFAGNSKLSTSLFGVVVDRRFRPD